MDMVCLYWQKLTLISDIDRCMKFLDLSSTGATHAVCRTQGATRSIVGPISMSFDRADVSFDDESFSYVEDPVIVDVYRQASILRYYFSSIPNMLW